MKNKIVIGVSGGIDSATSLIMLKEAGYDVVAVHLLMHSDVLDEQTKADLEKLTQRSGIDIIVKNVTERFKQLITNPFTQSYINGETPSPCTICNPLVKWHSLLEVADSVGAFYVATGHYCNVTEFNGKYYLLKGDDAHKDQSYYMWKLPQQTLARMMFPLGKHSKDEVRDYMRKIGYDELATKKESMGVCFLGNGGINKWLNDNVENINSFKGGEIVDRNGNVIGTHNGYLFYTLAQKKGLNIPKGLCVVEIDAKNNRLIVGDKNELTSKKIVLCDWNIVDINELTTNTNVEIKVRGIGINPKGYCKVTLSDDKLIVELIDDTAWAVTKGQPAVFYIENRLLGGGIVCDYE